MPDTAFQTNVPDNVLIPGLVAIRVGVADQPFSSTDESIAWALRSDSKFYAEDISVKDVNNRDVPDKKKVGLELVTLASPISMMKDIYFLCRRPFQAQVKTAEGLYLNFVRNSGGVLVPTGSNLLGGDWTLDITDKARSLKLDAYVEMLKTEYKWLWNNVTASTGGAGVLTGDLAAHDYSFDNYSQAGFEYFTIDGVDVGEFNSPHLVVKSVATKKDHRGRSINRRTSAVLSFNMLQTTVNEHLAVATTASHDKTIIGYTYDGEQFKFTAGAGSVSMKTEMGDKDNFITLTIGGEVLNNPLEGTETSLKFSGTPPNIMEFVMINY